MTMDKEARIVLIKRYLKAETSPTEEKMLRDWYATHPADEDERAEARLIGLSAPCGQYLAGTDHAEAEFERILAAGERKRRRKILCRAPLAGGAFAAAAALLLWLVPARQSPQNTITSIQIADGIRQIMLLEIGDIESVTATPSGSYAVLTAHLKDGNTCAYIMTFNEEDGTTSLLADTNRK